MDQARDPEDARRRDMALSLRSMLTRHIDSRSLFALEHEKPHGGTFADHGSDDAGPGIDPLEARIHAMCDGDPDDLARDMDSEGIAENIARDRMWNRLGRVGILELASDVPHLSQAEKARLADDVFYKGLGQSSASKVLGPDSYGALVALQAEVDREVIANPPVPNAYDRVVAAIHHREWRDPRLSGMLRKVLAYGVPEEAVRIRQRREDLLNDLREGRFSDTDPNALVKDLYASFTRGEVRALLDGEKEGPLPRIHPDLDKALRSRISQSMLQLFSRVDTSAENVPAISEAGTIYMQRTRPDPAPRVDRGPLMGSEPW